jgi:hypothetical protein
MREAEHTKNDVRRYLRHKKQLGGSMKIVKKTFQSILRRVDDGEDN